MIASSRGKAGQAAGAPFNIEAGEVKPAANLITHLLGRPTDPMQPFADGGPVSLREQAAQQYPGIADQIRAEAFKVSPQQPGDKRGLEFYPPGQEDAGRILNPPPFHVKHFHGILLAEGGKGGGLGRSISLRKRA